MQGSRGGRAVVLVARRLLGLALAGFGAGCAGEKVRVPLFKGGVFDGGRLFGGPPLLVEDAPYTRKPHDVHRLKLGADGAPVDTVIGRARTHEVRKGETLLGIAR